MNNNKIESVELMKRDSGIEMARLIGCLIVISCHTLLPYKTEATTWDTSRLMIAMLSADGVGVFWMISGAFLFATNSYKDLVKKSFRKIFLPMLCVGGIYFYLGDWIVGKSTFLVSLSKDKESYMNVLNKILLWRNGVNGYGHSWYVWVYMLLILTFPALKGIVDYLNNSKNKKVFIVGTLFFTVLNDYARNKLFLYSHDTINALIPAGIILLWGYVIYQYKYLWKTRIVTFGSVGLFMLSNCVRLFIQQRRVCRLGSDAGVAIMYWYSSLGMIAAGCLICFCISLIQDKRYSWRNRCICLLASYSFPVYLIHMLVRDYLRNRGFEETLQKVILGSESTMVQELIYQIVIVFSIFLVSCVIISVWRTVTNKMKIILRGIAFNAFQSRV